MQVIQQIKKHTTSNKNYKSPINRGVKNHTFKFNKHTFNSYIKNMHRITSIGVGSSFLLVLLILAICIPLYKDELNTKATTGTSTQATTSLALSSGASSTASIDLLATSSNGTFVSSSDSGSSGSGGDSSSNGSASYNVYTTNYTGYTLVIASSTSTNYNDGKLTMSGDSSNYFSTITDTNGITASTFSDSTSTGTAYNGKWGFKPSKYYNTSTNTTVDNTNTTTGLYFPAPSTTGFTIAKTTTANGSTTSTASSNSNNYTFAIGARADQTQKAGTYTNTYVLQAVGNPVDYAISYVDNSGDSTVANMPSSATTGSTSSTSITLSNTTPTRTGYTFSGWCNTATTEAGTKCNGGTTPTFTAGGDYGIDQNTVNATTLYATWTINKYSLTITFAGSGVSSVAVKSGSASGTTIGTVSTSGGSVSNLTYNTTYYLVPTFSTGYELDNWSNTGSYGTISSTSADNPTFTIGAGNGAVTITGKSSCTAISGYMQDFTGADSYCDSGTLTDRRDSKTYNVAKLADGEWWMTENLAIDLTATSYDTLYGTGSNAGKMTNATSQALGYLKGTTTGTSSDQWAMSGVTKAWTSSYSYSRPMIAVDSSTSGLCNDAYCVNSDLSWSSTDVTSATINGRTSIAQGKIGVYYNYCAASAGSYCWGNGTSETGSPSSDPNTSSLRDITSDICPYGWRLPTGGSSGEFQNLYTQYSSNVTNFQTALVTPLSGYFDSGKAYNQGYSGGFWSSTWYSAYHMYSLYVRPSSVSPSYGHGRYYGDSVRCIFDPPKTMQSATSADCGQEMIDARDGNSYTTATIGSLCWMTQNLALGSDSTIALTQADSNVSSSGYTLPARGTYGTSNSGQYVWGNDTQCTSSSTTACAGYYSYATATAGTNRSSGASSYDICPAGWRLPTQAELTTLKNTYTTGATLTTSPFLGVYAGSYGSSSFDYGGSYGYYWSSTAYNSNLAYRLYFYSSSADVNTSNKRYGYSIRCVAKS